MFFQRALIFSSDGMSVGAVSVFRGESNGSMSEHLEVIGRLHIVLTASEFPEIK
jgi:hypothetical protein